jgi:hypothetical protein
MKSTALLREKKQIDSLFNHVQTFSGDSYHKALLTYYLCIRLSGYVENCVRIVFTEYSEPNCKGQVVDFVNNKLKKFPNPTWSIIIKLTKEFNIKWADELKRLVEERHRVSLNNIILNRNTLAHGGSSRITIHELYNYYQDVTYLIEKLEESCV